MTIKRTGRRSKGVRKAPASAPFGNSSRFLTTGQVAEQYGVQLRTVLMWIYRGQLTPSLKWGAWAITEKDLKDFERRRAEMDARGPRRPQRKFVPR